MRTTVLYTGGKDSTYALFWAIHQGMDILSLLTIIPKEKNSLMYHSPCIDIVPLLSNAIGIPVRTVEADDSIDTLRNTIGELIKKLRIDAIVSGAVRSDYQKKRIDIICEELGIISYAPLWHKSSLSYIREMISEGFEIIFTSVSAEGLGEEWLGRVLSPSTLTELESICRKKGINIEGEGGEFETLVLYCPLYKKKVIIRYHSVWNRDRGYIVIDDAKLSN